MEKITRKPSLPDTDSVEKLAVFWDSHDLTDFSDDLQEASAPVFVRAMGASLNIELKPAEAQSLTKIARSKGVKETTVLRQWILERLHESSLTRRVPDKELPRTRKTRRG